MNTHFYSLLIQSFLTGYEKPCEIKLVFMALPILIHGVKLKLLSRSLFHPKIWYQREKKSIMQRLK